MTDYECWDEQADYSEKALEYARKKRDLVQVTGQFVMQLEFEEKPKHGGYEE